MMEDVEINLESYRKVNIRKVNIRKVNIMYLMGHTLGKPFKIKRFGDSCRIKKGRNKKCAQNAHY